LSIKSPSIVALIPARSGSKRVPDKNIRELNGHPLIAYTITAAIKSGIFSDVIVSTDSLDYKNVADHYGAHVPFLRPDRYAGDKSPDIEWVTHALAELKNSGKNYKYFSILRPTSPFRKAGTIVRAWSDFSKNVLADSLRAVEKCSQHPAKMWYIQENFMKSVMMGDNNGIPWHSNQYQALPEIYVQNASLEISKTSNVFENKSISGDKIMSFITNNFEGFDLNQPYDWEYAKYLINQKDVRLPIPKTSPYKLKRKIN